MAKSTSKLIIQGGHRLTGRIRISGAKNAVLKELAATLLSKERVVLANLPHLKDTVLMLELLADLGAKLTFLDKRRVAIQCESLHSTTVPYDLVRAMRASIVVLGPLLAAYGKAEVALPGGCAIGARPVDIHLDGLRQMGARIEIERGFICASVDGRLKGAEIFMHTKTVTGTENLMMAATLAEGTTVLHNAAQEPEIEDLAKMLNSMGAKITGAGQATITIEGVEALHSAEHSVLPDRIVAGTYLVASVITGGSITVGPVNIPSLGNLLSILERAGAKIRVSDDMVNVSSEPYLLRPVNITTAPHPGFPTDMQAQMMVLNVIAKGASEVNETVFENRFMHVGELNRLGANIHYSQRTATIMGVHKLTGAPVESYDLRASAAMVLAGLVAEGETEVTAIEHLDRGYEFIEEKLSAVGADIKRVPLD